MIQVKSCLKTYNVVFEESLGFLDELAGIKNAEFVIDRNIYEIYKEQLRSIPEDRLVVVEALEENKVIDTALMICEKITELSAKRNATLISVGGGIIQDITGFVANIMYRGINWIFVPTTLLAACDSCIGGKTSLNYKKFKNLLGTFYPPDEIHICTQFFTTLTERDFKSGLGEVIKFNIMQGERGLLNIENNLGKLLERDHAAVSEFVRSSLDFKKKFIEVDEFDRGERIKLNFAHTFGHAIEVISEYVIPHGTAVAIGMIMADRISFNRGYLSRDIIGRSEKLLLSVISIDIELLNKPFEDYLKAIRKDKKQINDSLTAVLISKYGDDSELSIVHDVTVDELKEAIQYFCDLYKDEVNRK